MHTFVNSFSCTQRPPIPESSDPIVAKLIAQCWKGQPQVCLQPGCKAIQNEFPVSGQCVGQFGT